MTSTKALRTTRTWCCAPRMLLAILAALALLPADIGICGMISYSVTWQTHELGIRTALGAGRGSLLAMVIRRGVRLTAIGPATGVACAQSLTRLLGSLLFGISPRDPVTMAVVAAVLSSGFAGQSYSRTQGRRSGPHGSRCVTNDRRRRRYPRTGSPYRTSPHACWWGCLARARAGSPSRAVHGKPGGRSGTSP